MHIRSLQTATLLFGAALFLIFFQVPASQYIAFGLTGSVAGFLWTTRSPRSILYMVAAAAAFAGLYAVANGKLDHYPGWWLAYPGSLLGLAAIVVTILRWIWSPSALPGISQTVLMLVAIPTLCTLSTVTVGVASQWSPNTYDYTLYAFDQSLGAPAFSLGRFMAAHPALLQACSSVYNALPFWAALAWILVAANPPRRRWYAQLTFLVLGAIGFLLYQFCPAAGPAYRFAGNFPWTEPNPASLPTGAALLFPCPRNAMPSLHFAWALLFVFISLEYKWPFRLASSIVAISTLAAILASGEHYLVDAVISLPLLMSVIAVVSPSRPRAGRIACCTAGGVLTIAWLLAFRFGFALALSDAERIAAVLITAGIGIAGMAVLYRHSLDSPPVRESGSVAAFEPAAADLTGS